MFWGVHASRDRPHGSQLRALYASEASPIPIRGCRQYPRRPPARQIPIGQDYQRRMEQAGGRFATLHTVNLQANQPRTAVRLRQP